MAVAKSVRTGDVFADVMLFGAPGQTIKILPKPAPSAKPRPTSIEISNAPKLSGETGHNKVSNLALQILGLSTTLILIYNKDTPDIPGPIIIRGTSNARPIAEKLGGFNSVEKAYPLDTGFTTSCVDLWLGLCRFRLSGAAALALGRQDVASCGRFRAGSDALIDEIAIGCRPEAEADPEQRVESASRVTSSVPSEHELVKVALGMGLAQAVEDALRPALEVRVSVLIKSLFAPTIGLL
jgi:hypothetical protein